MKRSLFMLVAALLLCGCSTAQPNLIKRVDLGQLDVTPVQGNPALRYREGSGSLILEEGLQAEGTNGTYQHIQVHYSSKLVGENLSWSISLLSKGKGYSANVMTTSTGTILSTTIFSENGPLSGDDTETQGMILTTDELFGCFFVPLTGGRTPQNGVISRQPVLALSRKGESSLIPENTGVTILLGQTVYEGIPCYVLRHHQTRTVTLKDTREQVQYISDGYLLVNRTTMLPLIGEASFGSGFDGTFPDIKCVRRVASMKHWSYTQASTN